MSAWADRFVEPEPEEGDYEAPTEPKNVTPPKPSFADRVEAWHQDQAKKAKIYQRNANINGLLGLALLGVGAFFWPLWVLGVILLCVGFEQFREATHCRKGSRMLPDPNDLML